MSPAHLVAGDAAGTYALGMKWIDDKFRKDPAHYVLQTLMAFGAIAGVVAALGALTNGAMVAALGASAFIVFAAPHAPVARPRNLIGGHVLSMGIGLLCSVAFRSNWLAVNDLNAGLIGAAAVALSLFAMVITDTEHPPAAGNALAFAVTAFDVGHILFTLGAVVSFAVIRFALRHWLRDLV